MPTSRCRPYIQLQPEDRVTIASLRQQGVGISAIARVLQRSPSTVSRELQRNGCEGSYASAAAQGRCHKRRLSARPARNTSVIRLQSATDGDGGPSSARLAGHWDSCRSSPRPLAQRCGIDLVDYEDGGGLHRTVNAKRGPV